MAVTAFLDTSVLLAGLVDFGPQSSPSQLVLHAVAEKRVAAATAWHCCLEFYSVATRLPRTGGETGSILRYLLIAGASLCIAAGVFLTSGGLHRRS